MLDFGIAFNMNAGADRYAGMLAGSPSYMAPEQALGLPYRPQTDIFAIGVMLYEMLTGERPFAGGTTETLLAAIAVYEPPAPSVKNPNVHQDLDAVVTRCLAKDPDDRFPTARALFETLSAIAEGRSVDEHTAQLRKLATRRRYRRRCPPPRATASRRREEAHGVELATRVVGPRRSGRSSRTPIASIARSASPPSRSPTRRAPPAVRFAPARCA